MDLNLILHLVVQNTWHSLIVITGALGNDYTLKLKVSSIDPCWFLTARMQQQFTYSHSYSGRSRKSI